MNEQTRAFIATMNEFRTSLQPYLTARLSVPLNLIEQIATTVISYQNDSVSQAFTTDLKKTVNGLYDFSATRDAIDSVDSSFIIGVFNNPYNSKMGLECIICNQLQPDPAIVDAYPGKFSRVIEIVASTEGFNLNSCVALFAEHYVTDVAVKRENKACYFIDRFVIRYQKITKHILDTCVDETSLSRVRAATPDIILSACSVWLHLHEYSHRLGNMPLPEYLDFKTPRNAAAIEELRVDVLTVLLCYGNCSGS